MRSRELGVAIVKAGGAGALGRLLGVSTRTVLGWQKRGISAGGQRLLDDLKERQKLAALEAKGKRQTFDLLFKLAGERGDLPRGRTREGVRSGPRTSGYQWSWGVGEMLTLHLITRIDSWLTSHRRRFPFFQAVAVATEYTKQKFKGYKTVMKQVADVQASGDFAVEEQIATRRSKRLSEVRDELSARLAEAISEGALVFIHEVTLFNYRQRTELERLAWEANKRSIRKKKATRRKARQKKVEVWQPKKSNSSKPLITMKKAKKPTRATPVATKVQAKKKSKKAVASRSKSVSTRLQTTRSNLKRANVKASRPKTSVSRSHRTTSKKSGTKQKSSLVRSLKKQTLTVKKATRKTAKKATKKGRR